MDPSGLVALTSCRLIALDKCLVVRPIGIGEKAYRILGKAILAVMGGDIQETAGTQQLCAGQKAGCEAAIHATRQISEDANTQAVLLAFNNLNCQTALRESLPFNTSLSSVESSTVKHGEKPAAFTSRKRKQSSEEEQGKTN